MKIKVGIDWGNVFTLIAFPVIFYLFLWIWIDDNPISLNICIGSIFYIYFLSIFIVRIFYFYDEYYEVFFPTRIFHRRKRIFYNEIEKVTYTPGFAMGPLMVAKYGHKGFYGMKYNISYSSFKKKTKPLILFFRSKGIKVKHYSNVTTKEFEEMLKD